MDSKGDVDDEDDENNSLWMTATQFSQLLDKQETLENMDYNLVIKKKRDKKIDVIFLLIESFFMGQLFFRNSHIFHLF